MVETKAMSDRPPSVCSEACRIVSAIRPFSITTTMPRARPMISATPSRSRAPSRKAPVRRFSPSRPISPIRIAAPRNSAPIFAIHQPWLDTPQIIATKVAAKTTRITFCVPLSASSSAPPASPPRKWRRCASHWRATTERSPSAFTREA